MRLFNWLEPLVYFIGLAVCIWAYRICGKRGYLILATYFVLAAGALTVWPAVDRAIGNHRQVATELSPQARAQYQQELAAVVNKYFPPGRVPTFHIGLPIGPALLVLGLWVLARREARNTTEAVAAPTGGPGTQLGNHGATKGPPSVS